MKLKLTILLYFVFSIIYSQSTYKINYNFLTLFDGNKNHNSTLIFSNEKSNFTYKLEEKDTIIKETFDENSNILIEIPDNKLHYIYTDLKNNQRSELVYLDKDKYIVNETLDFPIWEITTLTKKKNNHLCYKATTFFKGRTYEAWFTLDYPTQHGPWKLIGLPGLILEASDNKNEVFFEVTQVKIINDKEFELFNDIQRIDNLEYQKKVKKHEDNIINHITSLGDRDITISVKISKKIGLEID
jgi:GLPGLI family protein